MSKKMLFILLIYLGCVILITPLLAFVLSLMLPLLSALSFLLFIGSVALWAHLLAEYLHYDDYMEETSYYQIPPKELRRHGLRIVKTQKEEIKE